MAPRLPGRRRDRPEEPSEPEPVRLDDDDHAWWAQRDISEAWTPRGPTPVPEEPEPKRDVLAEHFGADWRTSFGYYADAPPDPPAEPIDTVDASDPYAVLGVDATASWEDIVEAHRTMARRHHPDRLVGRSAAESAASEDRIRAINGAYAELRVRRGR